MKNTIILLLTVALCFSCSNDDDNYPTAGLQNSPIIGQFEVFSRCGGTDGSENTICPLILLCCDFITFVDDANVNDNMGKFTSIVAGETYTGVFTLNETNNTILLVRDDNSNESTIIYSFNDDDNVLSFKEYQDNNTDFDTSDWNRIE